MEWDRLSRRKILRLSTGITLGLGVLSSSTRSSSAQSEEIWPQFGYNSGNTGYAPSNTGPETNLSEHWTFEVGRDVTSSPVVAGGTVYFKSEDYILYAVDASTSEQQWALNEQFILSSPAVADGVVYVGSGDNNLYAVDASTGEVQWTFETNDRIHSSPTVDGSTVYVGSDDNNLYAVDASTGEEIWRFETGDKVYSSPAVAEGRVFIGSDNLYAVDAASGTREWIFETSGNVTSPAVAGDTVYAGSDDNNLHAVGTSTGERQWVFQTGSIVVSPAVADETVYVGSDNLYAVDAATGDRKWVFDTGSSTGIGGGATAPAVVDETVYIERGNLYAVDRGSGQQKGVFAIRPGVQSPPAIAGGAIYIGSSEGIYALTGQTSMPTATPTEEPTERQITTVGTTPASTEMVASGGTNEDDGSMLPAILALVGLGSAGAWWIAIRRNEEDGGSDGRVSEETESSMTEVDASSSNVSSPNQQEIEEGSQISNPTAVDAGSQEDRQIQDDIQSIRDQLEQVDHLVLAAEYTEAKQTVEKANNQLEELKEEVSQDDRENLKTTIRELERECDRRISDSFILKRLREMDPYEFEKFVAKLWEKQGWNAHVTSGTSDRGVDVIATKQDSFEKRRHLIQVKRYGANTKIGSEDIQRYAGLYARNEQVDNVFVVTSGRFTKEAKEVAENRNVSIVNHEGLLDMLRNT